MTDLTVGRVAYEGGDGFQNDGMSEKVDVDPTQIITDPRFIEDREKLAALINRIYEYSGSQPAVFTFASGQVVFGFNAAKFFPLQAENARLKEEQKKLKDLLRQTSQGDCYCEVAINNPMYTDHDDYCKEVTELFASDNTSGEEKP